MNEKEQMKLDMVKHLALRLMDENSQLTIEQALSTVINSDTYQPTNVCRTMLLVFTTRVLATCTLS